MSVEDLIILAADKNIEFAITGILSRAIALEIQNITYRIYCHPQKDPGCFHRADSFLRAFQNKYRFALVVFDYEGSGQENNFNRMEMEEEVFNRLNLAGWENRCAAIIIEPELENWVWSSSQHLPTALGFRNPASLAEFLQSNDFEDYRQEKPKHPKEALESALEHSSQPRSSSLYKKLATKVSLRNCTDLGFNKLKSTLKDWFG